MAKPELDYNVYAFDFSESDSPKVAQGLLSKLASNSPCSQSEMVTGRISNNVLGIFANGIRETLEVKLEFKPISIAASTEVRRITDVRSLKRSTSMNNVEPLYDLLSQRTPVEEDYGTPGAQNYAHSSRAVSPALSQRSFGRGVDMNPSRPASRMAQRPTQDEIAIEEQDFEDGPSKKRARLTQADWHGRASFGATAESLRVAVSTSASIREFRPLNGINPAVTNDLVPRAPTPRAAEKRPSLQRAAFATSSLRRQSTFEDYSSPAPSSEGNTPVPDPAIYGDDNGLNGQSPASPDIPSSPPEFNFHHNSPPPPSSPGLPELPPPELHADSGFQSGFQSEGADNFVMYERPKTPKLTKQQQGIRKRNSQAAFITVQPGPVDQLPQRQIWAPDFAVAQRRAKCAVPSSPTRKRSAAQQNPIPAAPPSTANMQASQPTAGAGASQSGKAGSPPHLPRLMLPTAPPAKPNPSTLGPNSASQPNTHREDSPHVSLDPKQNQTLGNAQTLQTSTSMTGSFPPPTNPFGRHSLTRSHSWAPGCSSDVESDGDGMKGKRKGTRGEGSGSQRRTTIELSLESAVLQGKMPKHCMNCGEIKPSTWRCYWITEGLGDGKQIEVGTKTGIHWVEPIIREKESDEVTRYRVYKQWSHLTAEEREGGIWEQIIFCNPCGDYIRKKQAARPPELWDPDKKNLDKARKRNRSDRPRPSRPKKPKAFDPASAVPGQRTDFYSDAITDLPSNALHSDIHPHIYSTDPAGPMTDYPMTDGPATDAINMPPSDAFTPLPARLQTVDETVEHPPTDLPDMSHLVATDDFQLDEMSGAFHVSHFPGTDGLDSAFGDMVHGSDFITMPISQEEIDKMLSDFPEAQCGDLDVPFPDIDMDWGSLLASTGMTPPKGWTPIKLIKTPHKTPGRASHAAILFSPSRTRSSKRSSNFDAASKGAGSKDSPIRVGIDTPSKPLGRLLFPSPRRPGEFKSLSDSPGSSPRSLGKRLFSALTSPPPADLEQSPTLRKAAASMFKTPEPKRHQSVSGESHTTTASEDDGSGSVSLVKFFDGNARDSQRLIVDTEATVDDRAGKENLVPLTSPMSIA